MSLLSRSLLLCLVAVGPLAHAAGMRTHMVMAQRAVDHYAENLEAKLPGLAALLEDETNRRAYFPGATFPDWGYPVAGARDAAEASHWRPFLDAYAGLLMERYPNPLEDPEAARHFAFFLGVFSHHISDTPWHFDEHHPHGVRQAFERAYEEREGRPTGRGLRGLLGDEYTLDIFDHLDFDLQPEMSAHHFWWPTDILLEAFARAEVEGVTPEALTRGLGLREAAWRGERWVAAARVPYIVYRRAIPWAYAHREGWAYGGYENCAAGIAIWNQYWFARWQGWHYYQQQPAYAARIREAGSYTPYRGVMDSTICSAHPGHNGGQEPLLEVFCNGDDHRRSVLLRFEIADIPLGTEIAEATLWMRPVHLDEAPEALMIHPLASAWVEGDGHTCPVSGVIGGPTEVGASWISSGVSPWATPGAGAFPEDRDEAPAALLPLSPAPGGPWIQADVTAVVQSWVNGVPNHGIMLSAREDDPGRVQFYSSQAWMVQEDGLGGGYRVAYRPTLIVKPSHADESVRMAKYPGMDHSPQLEQAAHSSAGISHTRRK